VRHITTECIHCGSIYYYQASGHGCHEKTNDSKYCKSCKQILINTLKLIPVKFEYRWIETDDLTKEEALNIIKLEESSNQAKEKFRKENANMSGNFNPFIGLSIRRVYPSLHNMKTGESSQEKGFNHNGFKYHISYWDSRPDDYRITKEVRWNLETEKEDNCDYGYKRNK
jgi:hypothetical protein